MNFFDVFPQWAHESNVVLRGRSLRLIALSALVYDDVAFYFELSNPELWGQVASGRSVIGVGTVKVRPDPYNAPAQALVHYLHKHWRCEARLFSPTQTYVLDENQQSTVLRAIDLKAPYLLILTPPRLGGGDEVPDALVQALYLMPLRRWRGRKRRARLLKVRRDALEEFLSPVDWDLTDLVEQTWAEALPATGLPEQARARPVLALRGLQQWLRQGTLPDTLLSTDRMEGEG